MHKFGMRMKIAIACAALFLAPLSASAIERKHVHRDVVPTPIKYVVVLIKENHTFDSYFTGFPGTTSSSTAELSDGSVIRRPRAPDGALRSDLCHSHHCARVAYANGSMNGFDKNVEHGSHENYQGYVRYTQDQIPNYWKYAQNYVLADHFFQTTLANSFSGHFALLSGFNVGLTNTACDCLSLCNVAQYDPVSGAKIQAPACWDYPSVIFHLPTGFTWAEYTARGTSGIFMNDSRTLALANRVRYFKRYVDLRRDLSTSSQANLIFVHTPGKVSEHPPAAICPGENETVKIINTIMSGPHWHETAVILTWDDWGGFYDSVSPQARRFNGTGDYFGPGFRLPLLIISPYARKGYVLKTRTDQTSLVPLIEDLWGLPRMAREDSRIRDTGVGSLLPAFDFHQPPRKPLILRQHACTTNASSSVDEDDEY